MRRDLRWIGRRFAMRGRAVCLQRRRQCVGCPGKPRSGGGDWPRPRCAESKLTRQVAERDHKTMVDPQGGNDSLGPRRGGQVGISGTLAMGVLLALAASGNRSLVACVVAGTAFVAPFAARIGREAGRRIAQGSIGSALGWGLLSGLLCLGCATVAAGVLGMLWAAFDGFSDPFLLRNYLRKPMLAVLLYGLFPAALWGLLCGVVLWALTRRRQPPRTA